MKKMMPLILGTQVAAVAIVAWVVMTCPRADPPATFEDLLGRIGKSGLVGKQRDKGLHELHIKHQDDPRTWEEIFLEPIPTRFKGHVIVAPITKFDVGDGVRVGNFELSGDPDMIEHIIRSLR